MCCSGKFGLISADIPYGDQKDSAIDPPWGSTHVATIVEGLWHMAANKSTVVIQVGGVHQAVQWSEALASAGFAVEPEPRVVCPSGPDRCVKYHSNPGRNRKVVSTAHYWVVAFKGMTSLTEVKGAPYGVFDQYSSINATVLSGCPVTKPQDRLLNKDGQYVRSFEKHIGESLELLTRSCSPFLSVLFLLHNTQSLHTLTTVFQIQITHTHTNKTQVCSSRRRGSRLLLWYSTVRDGQPPPEPGSLCSR